jgi:hypothetical protein
MHVADLEILRRDLAVYVTTILRVLNAPLHPFDYAAAAAEIRDAVAHYHQAANGEFDLRPVVDDLEGLRDELAQWRIEAEMRARNGDDAERRRLNGVLRRIARRLVPLNYARGERFDHDPALKFGAVPRLEAAAHLPSMDPALKPFARTALVRERNKVRALLREVRRELKSSVESRVLL